MKLIALFFIIFLIAKVCHAEIVDSITAKNVAASFYNCNSNKTAMNLKLAITEVSEDGTPVYYVFNVNSNDGFVIVAADYNASPILGYSTLGRYDVNKMSPATINWMTNYKSQISEIRIKKTKASSKIAYKWQYYQNTRTKSSKNINSGVEPLLTTKWNQSPYYNDLCPEGSVTGCVATSMAQVMKYWNYPEKGNGFHSYCNCKSDNYKEDYGILTANFENTYYNWSNMPNQLIAPNNDVAILMYHCGVSVNMDYSPNGSTAQFNRMIYALTKYFNYDSTTIKYLVRNTSDTEWINVIKTELDKKQPIIYNLSGAHSWVCDGYDANDYLHMNWGWGGSGNGYYALADTVHISNGYTFWGSKQAYSALIGIQPSIVSSFRTSTLEPNVFSFFPNPATNQITINTSSNLSNESVNVLVVNISGNQLIEEHKNWETNKTLNIKNLPSGIYLVQVSSESGKWTGKFIKK